MSILKLPDELLVEIAKNIVQSLVIPWGRSVGSVFWA
jgi:hypothetical protein